MSELENEINDIMTNAMKEIDDENVKHQLKVVEMLEQKMFDQEGLPELCQLFGILKVAEGQDEIANFIKEIPIEYQNNLIDQQATATNPCGTTGLMKIVPFGDGEDIYAPLQDIAIQTGIHQTCSGIMIRVPMTATQMNDENQTKYDGLVTCMALEETITVVVRMKQGNADVCDSEVYDMGTYQLGQKGRKLIDAVYMAHFLPKYIEANNPLFYGSILAFIEWRSEQEES